MRIKTVLNWSSGKDAAMAYCLLQQDERYEVTHLLTTVNREYRRIVMHGVQEELLEMQAERLQFPLTKIYLPASPSETLYKEAMAGALKALGENGVQASAFGDIFLEDLRAYREQQLQAVDMQAVFPLWKMDTRQLVQKVEATGIEAVIICVNEKFLGKEFLGRRVGEALLQDLPPNVDPCGEHGEFHTFVYNAPFFSSPIPIVTGETVYRKYAPADEGGDGWDTGFYFLDILPG